MNPVKIFLTIFGVGIALTLILGVIGLQQGGEEVDSPDAVAASPEELVQQSCIGCHGTDLNGGSGPAIIGTGLSKEEIVAALKEGPGMMPANLVPGQEEAVAEYLLSLE